MERWVGRVALVTGASVGIGAGICRRLVKLGLTVVGCARNSDKIERIAEEEDVQKYPGKLHAIKCDVSNESEILSMFDEIKKNFGHIDVCINNAGFSINSPLLTGETSDWRNMLDVNILALCICSREAVKLMREQGVVEGQIIQMGSIAGHKLPDVSMPGFNFYCGTKFMIRALTECLRQEVKAGNTENSRIRVSSISPALVESEFLGRCLSPEIASNLFPTLPHLQVDDVADAVEYILKSPPNVNVSDIIVQAVEKAA